MKRLISLLLGAALSVGAIFAQSRQTTCFDNGWKFIWQDVENAQAVKFNDSSWRSLNLPHDWSIEGENLETNSSGSVGYFPLGTGWYRKTFSVPRYSKSKRYTIEFDGVYLNSTVWINGVELGTWPYGYSSFSYDLTPYLKASGNVIAVRVDNPGQNSRWYSGSGIYRHVRLVETQKTYFDKWGVFNYTESIADGKAVVKVESSIVNGQASALEAEVRQIVIDAEGAEVASVWGNVTLPAGETTSLDQKVSIDNPQLWGVDTPYLYTLRSVILVKGKEVDRSESVLGVRTIEYSVDKGFLLNGEQVKMQGVNLHHDAGPVGAAVPERVWERRIEILKEGGCNAIRTAHNPPAPEFLDLCDKHGMLVMDEAFDMWVSRKNVNDYHIYFEDWHERDLYAMVVRDRNHPSVVMWSIGNEIRDQNNDKGPGIAAELIAICHKYDPTRLVTSGNDEIASNTPTTPEFLAAFENDIIGYNYPDRWRTRKELMYAIDKAEFPERRVVGTETTGYGGRRGVYNLPGFTPEHPDAETQMRQARPVAPQTPPQGAPQMGPRPQGAPQGGPQGQQMQMRRRPAGGLISSELIDVERRWVFNRNYDYVIGDFMWTGIDYYGETRWPSRGSSSGYLDNCGFKKDGYWFFKSIWSKDPVLHLMPHWNWQGNEGKIIQVACFTNMDQVELFVNGKSYGTKSREYPRRGVDASWASYGPDKTFATTADLHLTWDVEYQPGEIKAVGTKNGETYEEIIRTAGEPAQLRATVDRESFTAQPGDVAHITVEVLDADGNLCPYTDNLVKFNVKGARIIGVESGDLNDLSSCKASERKAFSGLCLCIVAADKPGQVSVECTSEGLASSTVTFASK